jgi:predicted thioesterase
MVYFEGEVQFRDTRGTPVRTSVRMGNPVAVTYGNGVTFDLTVDAEDTGLGLNESVNIRLAGRHLPEGEIIETGQMLLIPATDTAKEAFTGSPAGMKFTFLPEYIYNVNVFGAYFDGRHIYSVEDPMYVYYDYNEAGLNFDLTFDKEEYLPGDTVKAQVSITDMDGNPAQARLNVSVVDEAVLRANPNEPDFLGTFYGGAYHNAYNYDIYASYQPVYMPGYGGAEMGNGGYETAMLRDDFNDNPAFVPVETNANGRGSFTFTLSDAVTSWRLTTHGITKDGKLGDNKTNIIATLPFYTDIVVTDTFLAGDEVAGLIKAHGEMFRLDRDEFHYRGDISFNGQSIGKFDAAYGLTIPFNVGVQPPGEHTVKISASIEVDGEVYSDTMEKKIRVVESDTLLDLHGRNTLDESSPSLNTEYDILASPVEVIFTNADIQPIMDIMYSCVDYNSNRTDYLAGAAYAQAFWDRPSGEPVRINLGDVPELARVLSAQAGGIPELEYGEAEILYTARFAAALPELINADELKYYLQYSGKLYDVESGAVTARGDAYYEIERAAGYLALAALKEPVLLEIQEQIALIEGVADQAMFSETYEGRLRVMLYAAALCTLGDDVQARSLLDKYGEPPAEGLNPTNKEMLEAMELFCEAVLDPPAALETLKARSKPNKFVSDVLERIHFLKTAVPVSGAVSQVSYTLDGERKTAELNNFDCVRLEISAEQYGALNVSRISGGTNVDVYFTGSPINLREELNTVKMTKALEPVEGRDGLYKATLTIHEDPDHRLDDGYYYYYTVYDRIPSNMRFTRPDFIEGGGDNAWITNEGQRVKIWAFTRGNQTSYSFEYYVMRISEAEAVVPEAYISRSFDLENSWGSAK